MNIQKKVKRSKANPSQNETEIYIHNVKDYKCKLGDYDMFQTLEIELEGEYLGEEIKIILLSSGESFQKSKNSMVK